MQKERSERYARLLAQMIQAATVSEYNQTDKSKFYEFHQLLRKIFPNLFCAAEYEDFEGSFLLRWKGLRADMPVLLMNHHDVVEASGNWRYPPFSGTVSEGKLWGRGTLDTKSGLWAMLQAAEELCIQGFTPAKDIYFLSACTEETDGSGAERIAKTLEQRGLRFSLVLDEGGMILEEPIGGAKGTFAMIGLGEKGCADIKFTARSNGGHASTPEKNTPLVRLGKFMAEVDSRDIFTAELSPIICNMFQKLSTTMEQPLRFILGHPNLFRPMLLRIIPSVSASAGAMLKTTLAFTMAQGSEGTNVLPQEAWVIGNMRYSHHEGGEASIRKVRKLAQKYNIETVVLDPGFSSSLSSHNSEAFHFIEKAVSAVFPGVICSPYLMTGASDCRFMSRISDNCFRFAPFQVSQQQMDSIHGLNENIDISALAPAVDFYKYIIQEA